MKIQCPKCNWKPDGGAYWQCSCGCVWNTFATTGRCPECKKTWNDTQCPGPGFPGGCGGMSAHLSWYVDLNEISEELKKESFKKEKI